MRRTLLAGLMLCAVVANATGVSVDIPAGDLVSALHLLARQAGVELIFDESKLRGFTALPVRGQMSAKEAIQAMVKGTPVLVIEDRTGAIMIMPEPLQASQSPVGGQGSNADATTAMSGYEDDLPIIGVVVTGSRIRQTDTETAQPVLTLSRQDIARQGFTSVGALLQNISAAGAPPKSRSVLSGDETIGGTYISLRNIGAPRTLVLVNGKRMGVSTQGLADLSTLPLAAVERIEVLKDGASSIYGSDAIAGVVNIITRTHYDGATASVYAGQYSQGDGRITKGDVLMGVTGDRGSLTLAAEWSDEDRVAAVDRAFSAYPRSNLHPTDNWHTTGDAGGFITSALNPVPGIAENTRVVLRAGGDPANLADYVRQDIFIGSCVGASEATGCRPGVTADKVNPNQWLDLIMPVKRRAYYAHGVYDLSPTTRLHADLLYSNRISSSVISGFPMQAASWATPLSADSYFNPSDNAMASWWRRTSEVPRWTERDLTTLRYAFTVEGSIEVGQRSFDWDATYLKNENKVLVSTIGNLNLANTRLAVGPSFLNGQGQVQCGTAANPIAFSACVPWNPLLGLGQAGPGGLSGNTALQAFLFQQAHGTGRTTSEDVAVNLTGALLALPAGDLGFAAGFEHRDEQGAFTPDALVAGGGSTENASEATRGGYEVGEAYLEVRAPLLTDRAGARELTAEVAARYSDYSTFGNALSTKSSLKWRPLESVLFRLTVAEGFRAPTINDLYAGASLGFVFFSDPCDVVFGSSATNAGTRAQCAASMGTALANEFRQLNLTLMPTTSASAQTPYGFTLSGNPALEPEISRTQTLGLVWSPATVPGLNLNLDWWKIRVSNALTPDFPTQILQDCYVYGITSRCAAFDRDPTTGVVSALRYGTINAGLRKVEGIDLDLSYQRQTRALGRWTFKTQAVYTRNDFLVSTSAPQRPISQVGTSSVNATSFRVRANASVGWEQGKLGALWTMRYFSGVKEACVYFVPGTTTASLECDTVYEGPTGNVSGTTRSLQRWRSVGANVFHDVQLRWTLPKGRLSLGANNVFDHVGPVMYSNPSSSVDYYGGFDIGRFYYLSYAVGLQ
ncbi:TonB-dependent receptor plug domain-containing protein [Stenotrophomonas acidaminiphila]|uniref:TonB-dependent receptor plug domain-containing protein n=1 Tax=Stenotrophomonas acidaminiphila TaxID=128780 RepID=UPI0028B21A8C|nr:TonB-dependent receptor [Stenotrophomonas acidaminiphila]